MMTTQTRQSDSPLARSAFRAAMLMLGAAAGYDLFVFYLAFQSGAWQLFAHAVFMAVFCVVMAISARLSRRGRFVRGAGLQLAWLWLTVLTISALFVGVGVVMAFISLTLTVGIVSQSLSQRPAGRLIFMGIVVGGLALLLDLYAPLTYRLEVPALQIGAAVAAGALFLIYVLIIARQFNNYSLRTKLITGFVATSLVSMALVAVGSSYVTRNELFQNIGQNLKTAANDSASSVANILVQQVNQLEVLALENTLRERIELTYQGAVSDRESVIRRLKRVDEQWPTLADNDDRVSILLVNTVVDQLEAYRKVAPDNLELMMVDRYGKPLAATNRPADYYQGEKDWWRGAYNNGRGAVYIGQPTADSGNGAASSLAFDIAVPVFARGSTELIGVLHTTFNMRPIAVALNVASSAKTGERDLIFPSGLLLDGDGHIEQFELPEMNALATWTDQDYADVIIEGGPVFASQSFVKSPESKSALAIEQLGWRMVLHQDRARALAPIETQQRTITLLAIGVGLLVALAGVFAGQVFSRPILNLTETAAKVSAGDLTARANVESGDEVGRLAQTFNTMTSQLQQTVGALEQRVQERTRALAASAEVSRRLSTILDRDHLIAEVVNQIRSAFNYYYAQIYLLDEERQTLMLAGGTGETGKLLLAKGHQLEKGKGLVGRAAAMNEVVLVTDTRQNPAWAQNVLLPDTKSEIAVPITLGGKVLGVLDVQHSVRNGLTQTDADLLQSIANQVAVALQNASSFEQTRQRAEREVLINTINQKIQRANTVENVLQIAVGELGQALGTKRTIAQLTRPGAAKNNQKQSLEPGP